MRDLQDRFRGALLGLAVGEALGTTVEFAARGSFPPVTDMTGGGPFGLPPGAWTDDTSMALCLASSLVECGFDPRDQIERYCRWYEEGYWSSTGRCFDIGNATRRALRRYRSTGDPAAGSTDPHSAGNGCIMRLAPVPMFFFPDEDEASEFSARSSVTTHQAAECLDAARVLARMIVRALAGQAKDDVLNCSGDGLSPAIAATAAGEYRQKDEADIRGSGHVVSCLEAAVWCFASTDTFEDAVLRAVNLGEDADTTAAVCGQLAGAFYGAGAIRPAWRQRLHRADDIMRLADLLLENRRRAPSSGKKPARQGPTR